MYTRIVNEVDETENMTKKKYEKIQSLEKLIVEALSIVNSRHDFLCLPFLKRAGSVTNLGDIGTRSCVFWICDLITRYNVDNIKVVCTNNSPGTGFVFRDGTSCLQVWHPQRHSYEYKTTIYYENDGRVPLFEII